MKPLARTDARSPALLPCTRYVTAATTPTNPVKMLSTATSRFWMNRGDASALGGGWATISPPSSWPAAASRATAPAGTRTAAASSAVALAGTWAAAEAARACPTSQMPFTTSTAPTYNRTTPSSTGSHSLSCQSGELVSVRHPRWGRRPAPRQRAPALLRDHAWFVRARLLVFQRPPHRRGEPREARRGEDPPGLTKADRTVRSVAGFGHRARQLERPAVAAAEHIHGHNVPQL